MTNQPRCGGKPNCPNLVGAQDPRMLAFAVDGDRYLVFWVCYDCHDHLRPEDGLAWLELEQGGLPTLDLSPIQVYTRRSWLFEGDHAVATVPKQPDWAIESFMDLISRGHDLHQATTTLALMVSGPETRH